MTQKPPESPRDDADTDPPDALARDEDPTAPTGIPAISRNIEIAAESALASMLVSFSKTDRLAGAENERATMPPPVPMEQLVEHMMLADSDRAPPPDIKPLRAPKISDSIPPPGSDVDTVRTKMADMQRVPMSPIPASPAPSSAPPPDDLPTLPPFLDTADTLPPSNIDDEVDAGGDDFVRHEATAATSVTARAIDAAEAVFEELGVELLKTRSTSKEPLPETSIQPRFVEERPKFVEERPRPIPPARNTPPRTMRPTPDATPPSSSSGRNPAQRRRISETGFRAVEPPQPIDRLPPSSMSTVGERLAEVRERYESGDHRAALRVAESILSEHPDHLAAVGYAESSRQMLRQKYLARIGELSAVPRLKPVAIELARLGFDGRDRRIVDAIDGVLSVEGIVAAVAVPTLDVLRVLHDLALDGLVEFVGIATERR